MKKEIFEKHSFIIYTIVICLAAQCSSVIYAQNCQFTIARLHYQGGGDWYANPSSLPNLIQAVKEQTNIPVCDSSATIQILDDNLFRYPFLYMTGHGNVHFTHSERIRLRKYLENGGFLWADDNYGMDKSFRKEMTALFPENPLVNVPKNHGIYKSKYKLNGLPKIHEHDGNPAQGLGIFFNNQLVIFYSYSSDIGDGMEDVDVHNDGEKLHGLAIKMGVNIITWFFDP